MAPTASASLTPPPTGDWTIDVGENAVLTTGTTTVTGNITVRGSLTVTTSTLELVSPAAGVIPRLFVQGPAAFTLDSATLRAAGGPSANFTLDASAGATVVLRSSSVQGLGSTTQGGLALVGAHFVGATVQVFDTIIDASNGGLGFDLGSTLTARNVAVTVQNRSLYLSGASSANLDGFSAKGRQTTSEFLVLINGSTLTGANVHLDNGTNLLLLLSSTATLTNATLENATHAGVLLVGSTLSVDVAFVAPHVNDSLAFEAYGSSVSVARATFQNYSFGIAALGSTVDVHDTQFITSNTTPRSSFAALYTFDSNVTLARDTFNGSYFESMVPLEDENGTPVLNQTTGLPIFVPNFNCANAALWFVRSQVQGSALSSACYSDHVHVEESTVRLAGMDLTRGNSGLSFIGGSLDAQDITVSNFSRGGGATGARFLHTVGLIQNLTGMANSIGVEFTDSPLHLSGFRTSSPGLGVSVRGGSPTVENSNFTVHNETGIQIYDGLPHILNTSFWVSANQKETYGIAVYAGEPLIQGNDFHGGFLLTYGVYIHGGPAHVNSNFFEHFDRAAQFSSRGFEAVNNSFTQCSNGLDARDGAVGTVAANRFFNMTEFAAGNSLNVYFSAPTLRDNTFTNVNYGIKVFSTNASLNAPPRISGNRFDDVALYAIEIINASMPVLVDNNTARNATRGGIEALFSNVTSAYNVVYDGEGYGYELTNSSLTIVGGRLENLREGIHAVNARISISYTTFLLNHAGMTLGDTEVSISNSSFQFNGIAAQFVSNKTVFVNDSIFVGNVESLLVYNNTDIHVRDTNFIGTLDYILRNDQASTGSIEFTRRGELNGGRFLLRGVLTSTADALILRSLKMMFASPPGYLAGATIRGAQSLTMTSVSLANSSAPFFFEIEDSAGNLSQVAIRAAWPSLARPGLGPYIVNSQLNLRDFSVNESMENFTVEDSTLTVTNLSIRENSGAGVVLRGTTLAGPIITILDNALCGVEAWNNSVLSTANATLRGNNGGSLCFHASRADVLDGDFSSRPFDLTLDDGSEIDLVSTTTVRGWVVNDTSLLSIAWRMDVRVSYPNPALLPQVSVSIVDAKGHAVVASPEVNGRVETVTDLPERFVRSTGEDVRTPYSVLASYANASATQVVALTADRLVELDLADRLAPTVRIDQPTEGQGFNVSTVTLGFHAADVGSGIDELLYRFGAGAFNAVDPLAGPFFITRDLVDGDHTFIVRAVDFGGNVAETSVNFTVDTRPPLITVVGPRAPANTTRAAAVNIQVTVESDVVQVWIGGVEVNITAASASRSVPVPEGASAVVIDARDHVGNMGSATVYIMADRTAPNLTLEVDATHTAESFAIVRGHTEAGSQVVIGNTAVPLDGGDFELLVYIQEGKNNIEVRAKDALQNENVKNVTVTRGTLQPSHVLDIVADLGGLALLAAGAALAFIAFRRGAKAPPAGGAKR